jgi:hypothetical protein
VATAEAALLADNPYIGQEAIGQRGRDRRYNGGSGGYSGGGGGGGGYRSSPRGYRSSPRWSGNSFFTQPGNGNGHGELRRSGGSGNHAPAADQLPRIQEHPLMDQEAPPPGDAHAVGGAEYECQTPTAGRGHADSDTDAISAALTPPGQAPAGVAEAAAFHDDQSAGSGSDGGCSAPLTQFDQPDSQQAPDQQPSTEQHEAAGGQPQGSQHGAPAAAAADAADSYAMPTIAEDSPLSADRGGTQESQRPSYSAVASSPRRLIPRLNASDPIVSPGRITIASKYKAARYASGGSSGISSSTSSDGGGAYAGPAGGQPAAQQSLFSSTDQQRSQGGRGRGAM